MVRCYLSKSDLSLINHWLYRSHRWLRVMCHAPPPRVASESWFYPANISQHWWEGGQNFQFRRGRPRWRQFLNGFFVLRPIFSDHSDQQQQKTKSRAVIVGGLCLQKKKTKNMHEDSKTVILKQKLPTEERFRLPVGASGLSVAGHVFSLLRSSSRLYENSFSFLLEMKRSSGNCFT